VCEKIIFIYKVQVLNEKKYPYEGFLLKVVGVVSTPSLQKGFLCREKVWLHLMSIELLFVMKKQNVSFSILQHS